MGDGPEQPALQVIVLGSGGGPKEDNVTAFLVRSIAAEWRRGSVLAVDAGIHLAAVARIIEPYVPDSNSNLPSLPITLTSGPFNGLQLPCATASANAAHITRYLVDTFLVTHPHLDHIAGFVINTAGLPGARPKRLAALPPTIAAFKAHIFNNVIWPNLSDEDNGVGLVTYMRLLDGGSPALGDGDSKGYVEICEGLSVKALSVSHGHCMEKHTHRGSGSGLHLNETLPTYDESPKHPYSTHGRIGRSGDSTCVYDSSAYFIRDVISGCEVLIFGDVEPDSISLSPRNFRVWNDAAPKIASGLLSAIFIECSYDDSQGDDQLYGHLVPRHLIEEMKVLATCVTSARQDQDDKEKKKKKKRKIPSGSLAVDAPRRSTRVSKLNSHTPEPRYHTYSRQESGISPRSTDYHELQLDGVKTALTMSPKRANTTVLESADHPMLMSAPVLETAGTSTITANIAVSRGERISGSPLKGLKIVIIHVKERLDDGPHPGQTILEELQAYEEEENLGCEFVLAKVGMAVYL